MKHHESQLQQSCVRWFRLQYPEPKYLIFAIPNGGKRSKALGGIMKAEGLRAGMPDLCVMSFDKVFFMETKEPGKGVLNQNQKKTFLIMRELGYHCFVYDNVDDFISIAKSMMK